MTEEERKERKKASRKKWEDANKEKRAEIVRRYKKAHREELNQKTREYHAGRRDKIKEYNAEYKKEHAEEVRIYTINYRNTKRGRAVSLASAYRTKDRKKGFDTTNTITADWIEQNIFNGQVCHYCGNANWRDLGVDRISNDKPHYPDNCICACWDCNNERKNKWSVEEFVLIKKKEKGGA